MSTKTSPRLAALALLAAGALHPAAPAGEIPVVIRGADATQAAALPGRLVAQRDGHAILEMDEAAAARLAATQPGVTPRPEYRQVLLHRRVIDTAAAGRRGAAEAFDPARPLRLVQFAAPPTEADVATLEAAGARLVQAVPHNARIVWVPDAATAARVEALLAPAPGRTPLQWTGAYRPEDALLPSLDGAIQRATGFADVTVQLFADAPEAKADFEAVTTGALALLRRPEELPGGRLLNVTVRVPASELARLAALPTVVAVEPHVQPELHGERQAQAMAANLDATGNGPSGPGYIDWLRSLGFSEDPADYPIVVVVDDGVESGPADSPARQLFRVQGDPAEPSRIAYRLLPPGAGTSNVGGEDGHGHINASIVAGFDKRTGIGFEDAEGFNFGLGVSPFGRVASMKVFSPGFDDGTGIGTMVAADWANGARVSTNSWGANVFGAYNSDAQLYDALTRDASTDGGLQQLLFLFSAGNSGPGANSIGSPGTAKNVLTVGAAETSNPAAAAGDGCDSIGSEGDSINDVAPFSSRGPTDDSRVKPDILAPGTFIMGSAPIPEIFNGSGVCGAATNNFSFPGDDALFPAGTEFTWSSGTSHSTPGVAGQVSLIAEWLVRVHGFERLDDPLADPALVPTPALLKAAAIHSARHMTGAAANDTLPSHDQGFGFSDMALGFSDAAPRTFLNQSVVLTPTENEWRLDAAIPEGAEPVRIALAWTDAPGPLTGNAYLNDLDLRVLVNTGAGDVEYLGNVFNGADSVPGGSPDPRNNVECVFLPAGNAGFVTIIVEAASIIADGVPGNAISLDQDFALVAYNVVEGERAILRAGGPVDVDDSLGDADGAVERGEAIRLSVPVENTGTADATALAGTLVSLTEGVTVTQPTSAYPLLAMGATQANATPFEILVGPEVECEDPVRLRLLLDSAEGAGSVSITLPTGPACDVIPRLAASGEPAVDDSAGNQTGGADPGETVGVTVALANLAGVTATDVTGVLSSSTPGVTVLSGPVAWPDITDAAPQQNLEPFLLELDGNFPCGEQIALRLDVDSSEGPRAFDYLLRSGLLLPVPEGASRSETPAAEFGDAPRPQSILLPLEFTEQGLVQKVTVTMNVSHTYTRDVQMQLIGPDGTTVKLYDRNGSAGDNFSSTTFDDDAQASITSGVPPFAGSFRPLEPLAIFAGQQVAGTWTLAIQDLISDDNGIVNSFSIGIDYAPLTCDPTFALLANGVALDDSTGNGNGNGVVEPGETTVTVLLPVTNAGSLAGLGAVGTLSSLAPTATVVTPAIPYGDIAPNGGAGQGALPFLLAVDPSHPCFEPIELELLVESSAGASTLRYTIPTGATNEVVHVVQDMTSRPIGSSPSTFDAVLNVSATGNVVDVDAGINASHPYVGDLEVKLLRGATESFLINNRGGSGDNLVNTIFDDEAPSAVTSGTPPFTGIWRPETQLSVFDGQPAAGAWTFRVTDTFPSLDSGTVTLLDLTVTTQDPVCAAPRPLALAVLEDATNAPIAAGSGPWHLGEADLGGEPLRLVVRVEPTGAADLVVHDITMTGGFQLEDPLDATISSGASDTFTVALDPVAPGAYSGQVTLRTNLPGAPLHAFTVTANVGGGSPSSWMMLDE